jgi:hypothetical protein
VREDGAEVFEVLVHPTHGVQHENTEGGIDLEGAGFTVAEEVVLQG